MIAPGRLRAAIRACIVGVGVLLSPLAGVAQDASPESSLQLNLWRTWDSNGITVVDGLASVPLSIVDDGVTGAYRFEITVYDAEGHSLYEDGWDRTVSERAVTFARTQSNTSLRESFRFGVRPGSYEVVARAYPTDEPELEHSSRRTLEGYKEKPRASDLFLASRIEPVEPGSGGTGWPIVHDGYGIGASVRTIVLPEEPKLYYYLEVAAPAAEGTADATVSVTAEILAADGRSIYQTPSSDVVVAAPRGRVTGFLPIAGLPPGEYKLAMHVGMPASQGEAESSLVRVAPFDVWESAPKFAASEQPGARNDYFQTLGDKELETTFGGVSVFLGDEDRRMFEALPPDAKRRYLAGFFAAQDDDPATPQNDFFDEYVRRIGAIRARYSERVGTKERGAWLTDRGRIYLKYGEPDNRIVEHFPSDESAGGTGTIGSQAFGGEPPYEIWRYGNSTGFVYLFVAEGQLSHWRMIYSTDPDVQVYPNWTRRVGPRALRDLGEHFGINPRFGTGLDEMRGSP